tara:strand:- start:7353 stop:8261 length:909 start_codon:yes stop_codon:yes gene_type:complete
MASTLPPPSGSLVEYLEQMRQAINRAINLIGDENILVTETTHGKELSFIGELGGGAAAPFFGKITGWESVPASHGGYGKRWRYSWEEVIIGDEVASGNVPDPDQDVSPPGDPDDFRRGLASDTAQKTYLINLAEINNTAGASTEQGNGMELVAPLGGGFTGKNDLEHERIVPIWTSSRQDGSVLYWTNIENSDHVRESAITYSDVGVSPATDTDETGGHAVTPDTTGYVLSDLNGSRGVGGEYLNGAGIAWQVDQRTNYSHSETTPALRSFYRQLVILPNGKVKSVLREYATIVDTPEDCET